jgi:hypothetical protein
LLTVYCPGPLAAPSKTLAIVAGARCRRFGLNDPLSAPLTIRVFGVPFGIAAILVREYGRP